MLYIYCLLVLIVFASLFLLNPFITVFKQQQKVLLISFDGFRYNYLDRTDTPWFDKLIQEGVKAKWIEDSYISQTFPNHYTIATGVYEETHGIVANRFYDPIMNKSFVYTSKEDSSDPKFWGAEPIWVTNQKQDHSTGVYFWVGSEVKIDGTYPTVYKPYNASVNWFERVDTVVSWLANQPVDGKELDINLALLYFSQPDHYGHKYGPESREVTEQIKRCDTIVGYLLVKLIEEGLYDDVNIVITSDHGMSSISNERRLVLSSALDKSKVERFTNLGVAVEVWPKPGQTEEVYQQLLKLGEHVNVYKKENIPERFHYKNNVRVPPVFVQAKEGWFIVNTEKDDVFLRGTHGYDNSLMDMHPFFIARGPSFLENFVSEPFSNVNIYPMICNILGIYPAPNNGSLSNIDHILNHTEDQRAWLFFCGYFFCAISILSVLGYQLWQGKLPGSSTNVDEYEQIKD